MLSEPEIEAWIKRWSLTAAGEKELRRIRGSPPLRRVGSSKYGGKKGKNYLYHFASDKMGMTSQGESENVEYAGGLLGYEYNNHVLEFWDQAIQLSLKDRRSSTYEGDDNISVCLRDARSKDDASKQTGVKGAKAWRATRIDYPVLRLVLPMLGLG